MTPADVPTVTLLFRLAFPQERSEPPYELRLGIGRRGPEPLSRRFDRAVVRLRSMAAGTDILEVARAYDDIASVAGELAEVVTDEDGANGLRRWTRVRRSA